MPDRGRGGDRIGRIGCRRPTTARPTGASRTPAVAWVAVLSLVVAALVLLAGCSDASVSTGAAEPGQRPRTDGPAKGAEVKGKALPLFPATGLLLGTPIYDGDFADPYVLRVGDDLFAYATNDKDANVPVIAASRPPFAHYVGDVLPDLPSWSEPGFVWAPAVLALERGYVLYYTTRVSGTTMQCVSRATSDSPTGPFRDDSTGPLVCQRDLGGTIDPSIVTDADGVHWLLFKNDGNCCDIPTSIWIQRLSPDGLTVQGEPIELLLSGPQWEGRLIEGPSMILADGRAYLFYSGNAWDTDDYAIGYAVCEEVTGPCRRPESVDEHPWMSSTKFAGGPGGQEFFGALGKVFMVYHGWEHGQAGTPGAQRRLYLDIVEVDHGVPVRVGARTAGWTLAGAVALAALIVVGGVLWWRRRRRGRPATEAGDEDEGTR